MELGYEFYLGNLEVSGVDNIGEARVVLSVPLKELAKYLYPYFIEIHANKVFKG